MGALEFTSDNKSLTALSNPMSLAGTSDYYTKPPTTTFDSFYFNVPCSGTVRYHYGVSVFQDMKRTSRVSFAVAENGIISNTNSTSTVCAQQIAQQ